MKNSDFGNVPKRLGDNPKHLMDISERLNPDLNLSFLLRAWAESSESVARPLTWRYSLQDLKTKARRGFADLESLLAYLENLESEGVSLGSQPSIGQE